MDLLGALDTFIRIVETGSFSAVARESRSSHSAVTRLVGQLEEHFGVRLFHRTTRRLNLTEDGQDLLGYARSLIEAAKEMEGVLGRQRSSPTGLVRVGLPVAASMLLVPRLPEMLNRYPGLAIELVVGDRFGDLVEERLDVALLGGPPPDNSLVGRAVGSFGRIAVAGPSYLERYGAPAHPTDLARHICILHEYGPDSGRWAFTGRDGAEIEVHVSGPVRANNSEVVHRATLGGHGISLLSELQVADDIRAARLYRLLPDFPTERVPIHLVYPSRRHLAPRVRVVIDFLAEHTRRVTARMAEQREWGESDAAWLV